MYFGEKLKRIRQEKGWTQPDLAERLGIEQSWLSKIENDKSLPSSELLDQIAETFNLTLNELLEDLDPGYVTGSLASLPAVRGIIQQRKYRVIHNARMWLIGASVCLALGWSFFLIGAAELFFENQLYLYESDGMVYESEPENLFHDRDNILESWVLSQSAALDPQSELSSKRLQISGRENYQQIVSREYLGTLFTQNEIVSNPTIDIFDNEVPAGSTGSRTFSERGTREMQHPFNSIMLASGLFLMVLSFGFYFTEFRVSRISRLSVNANPPQ